MAKKKIRKFVIMPVSLYKDSDRLFAEQSSQVCDYIFRFGKKIPSLEDIEDFKESAIHTGQELSIYIMGANGKLMKINDYQKAIDNLEDIYYSTLNEFKESLDEDNIDPYKFRDDLLKDQAMITSSKEEAEKNKLLYVENSMVITSLYTLYSELLDTMNTEKTQEAIRTAIIEERIEHGEDQPRNELDIVNNSIKQFFPKDYERVEVDSCTYNGEDISHADLINKLSSHMLPQYITQVDITTTLDDNYTIKTNLGTIVRSKGGKITVYAKEK